MPGRRITFRSPFQLRLFSLTSIIWPLLLTIGIIVAVYGILFDNKEILMFGSVLLGIFFFLFVVTSIFIQRLKCPVCLNPVIANKKCARNPNAKKIFGISYTYKVIFDSLFTKHFKCQYCGERIRNTK